MKPTTFAVFALVTLWVGFQLFDDTPPPVLDQLLVGTFGVWFANEAVDKRKDTKKKSIGDGDDEEEGANDG